MARTTPDAVKAVLGYDYDTANSPSLVPYIDAAAAVVTRVVNCATLKETPLTADEAELVERWVAAHFYQQSDQGYTSRSTGGASGSFQGQTGMYFESTKYGQSAVMLDPSGCLTSIAARRSAGGYWLGTTEPNQRTYRERN
jgi:hypothetical protein